MAYPWEIEQQQFKTYPPRGISSNGMDIVENPDSSTSALIGHTLAWCSERENEINEALAKAEQYYNRLVELGDIVPQKTPEQKTLELVQSLTSTIQSLQKQMQGMSNKIEKLSEEATCKNFLQAPAESSVSYERQCTIGDSQESKPRGRPKNSGKPADASASCASGE